MNLVIVSIGTLAKNPLWGERTPARASHATTTLIRADKSLLLVDPSLPGPILEQRLYERSGLAPAAITDIFLTSWRPIHRRGLLHFPNAKLWLSAAELEYARDRLENAGHPADQPDEAALKIIREERALLERCHAAPDKFADGVDLFPLAGYTPGQAGLLISDPTRTTVIAGDAVPTEGHFMEGRVFEDAYDIERAKESMAEMYEIADVIVPGHDNIFLNPRAGGF